MGRHDYPRADMRTAIVNGRSIEHYKDFAVRETGLAVPREPKYRPAISNGYAPDDFIIDDSLVLFLPFYALKGSTFKSVDRNQHTCAVTGALWGPDGRSFDGLDDKITCTYDLDFNSAFTLELWYYTAVSGDTTRRVLLKNANNSEGIYISSTAEFVDQLGRAIPAVNRLSISSGTIPTDIPVHIVVTKTAWTGAQAIWSSFLQGVASGGRTDIYTFPNPTGAIMIGGRGSLGCNGIIPELRIYDRVLSLAELQHNRNCTIWRYQ